MSDIFLVLKGIGCVATTGAVGGVGYYGYNNYFSNDINKSDTTETTKKETKEESDVSAQQQNDENIPEVNQIKDKTTEVHHYLIKYSDNASNAKGDLYSGDGEQKTKNFSCKSFSSPTIVDDSCEIFKLSIDNGTTDDKFMDLSKINQVNTRSEKKLLFRENTYYKLKINKGTLTDSFKFDDSTLINLASSTEVFGKFTVLARLDQGEIKNNKKFVLVKSTSSTIDVNKSEAHDICTLSKPNENVSCKIIIPFENNKDLKKIKFSKLKKIQEKNQIQKDFFYILDFSDVHDKSKIIDENLKSISTSSSGDVENKQTINFEFVSHLSGTFDTETESNIQVFLLKDIFSSPK